MDSNSELYCKVESMVFPILKSCSKKYFKRAGLTEDEAMQEGRIALLCALKDYDYNNSCGGIYNFAKRSIINHFLNLVSENYAKKRRVYIMINNNPDDYIGDYMDTFSSGCKTPEDFFVEMDNNKEIRSLVYELYKSLPFRERQILDCRLNPPTGIKEMMKFSGKRFPTLFMIRKYLGLKKNAVDWSVAKIKNRTSKLKRFKFSDLS